MLESFFSHISQYSDFIILIASCAFLMSYFIRWVWRDRNNPDDEEGGGGGSNENDDPVLDLPPGVSLPKDKPEPELIH